MTGFEVAQVGDECVTYMITDVNDQKFASLLTCAFEVSNHGDISIINPFSGKRLWIGASAFDQTTNLYEALRRAITVAEKIYFLGDPPN